jgi:hypothetical protein
MAHRGLCTLIGGRASCGCGQIGAAIGATDDSQPIPHYIICHRSTHWRHQMGAAIGATAGSQPIPNYMPSQHPLARPEWRNYWRHCWFSANSTLYYMPSQHYLPSQHQLAPPDWRRYITLSVPQKKMTNWNDQDEKDEAAAAAALA